LISFRTEIDMENVRVCDVVAAVNGKLLCGDPMTPVTGAAIDSRAVKAGDLFVPIIGERTDAHRFIPQVLDGGAAATLTSEHDSAADSRAWIKVDDTVKALQRLGAWYRSRLKLPFIGITGSVGKTTTREMVAAALSAGKKVYSTKGNSNGQIGLPLTLIGADSSFDVGVLEMGMSMPGEMPVIASIARVSAAIVTMIGVSHIENLGSRENICAEKLHITDGFGPGNTAILNGDEPMLAALKGKTAYRIVYFGHGANCDYRCESVASGPDGVSFTAVTPSGSIPVRLRVPGGHNVMNALAALAAADLFGVGLEAAAEALGNYQGMSRRLNIKRLDNGVTIIDDAYNASPESMKAAFDVLGGMKPENGGRKAMVLADMLELGSESPRFHYETGRSAAGIHADRYFLIGSLAKHMAEAISDEGGEARLFGNNEDAAAAVAEWMRPGDIILVKGSNGMKLGEVISSLEAIGRG
jgi:UDP-N-acetylmuramoyl-tripeptide--D-alanyl-D-alanine ligase